MYIFISPISCTFDLFSTLFFNLFIVYSCLFLKTFLLALVCENGQANTHTHTHKVTMFHVIFSEGRRCWVLYTGAVGDSLAVGRFVLGLVLDLSCSSKSDSLFCYIWKDLRGSEKLIMPHNPSLFVLFCPFVLRKGFYYCFVTYVVIKPHAWLVLCY